MRDIVYREVSRGVFETQPTRAQLRKAEEEKKRRAELIQATAIVAVLVACMAFIIGANIAAFVGWL